MSKMMAPSAAQTLVSLLEPANPDPNAEQLHRMLATLKKAIGQDFSTSGMAEAKTIREVFSASSERLHEYSAFSISFDDAMGEHVGRIMKQCRVGGEDGKKWKVAYEMLQERMVKAVPKVRKTNQAKAEAFEVLKTYCGWCCSTLGTEENRREFEFYMTVDDFFHGVRGSTSVADAAIRLEKDGVHVEGEKGVARLEWYLRAVREKHRGDITVSRAQEKCGDCGEMKGEGEACSNCARLQKLLDEAQDAAQKGDWEKAQANAKEVLTYWKRGRGKEEAERIEEKARAALQKIKEDKPKVREAEKQISGALAKNPPDIDTAWTVWKEARELHGFEASKWEDKIREREGEKERQEREKKEQEARDAALGRFKEALGEEDWDKAEGMISELVHLGAGKEADFRKQIDAAKANKEVRLSSKCDGALKKAEVALLGSADKANPEEILEELNKAKQALNELDQSFKNSPNLKRFRTRIAEAETKFVVLGKRLAVKRLKKVRELAATGSLEGAPVVTVSWKAAEEGTPATKWQVLRRKKGGGSPEEVGGASDRMSCTDRSSGLKIGVEYEYGVVPLPDIADIGWRKLRDCNPAAVAWSAPVVCLHTLGANALHGSGDGEAGGNASVTLNWTLPFTDSTGKLKAVLTRRDGSLKEDVTLYSTWTDTKDVVVGTEYEYTLALTYNGRDLGKATTRIRVKRLMPPPRIARESVEITRDATNELKVRWAWPEEADECVWAVVARNVQQLSELPEPMRNHVYRESASEWVHPRVARDGRKQWLALFAVAGRGGRPLASDCTSIPISETIISYHIENHPAAGFSRRKPAWLVVETSSGHIPELAVLAGRTRSAVVGGLNGEPAFMIEAQELRAGESLRLGLDGIVASGKFVRLYCTHAKSENCRLEHPNNCEVK